MRKFNSWEELEICSIKIYETHQGSNSQIHVTDLHTKEFKSLPVPHSKVNRQEEEHIRDSHLHK